jgi:hypothetical protein
MPTNATHGSKITRRGIQIALGLMWFLDGVLQLQPQMFTSAFAHNVIAPAASGQPDWISGPMHFFMGLFLWQPALSNSGIAVIQMGLGLLILFRKTSRIGLILSVFWGLFVWYIGEGLSGLASGHAMMLMGLPGAALIYALLALAIMVPAPGKVPHDNRPAYWLIVVWAVLWSLGSVYQVLPGQNTVADVGSMISSNADGAPSWLASIDNGVAKTLDSFGTASDVSSMPGMPGMRVYQAPAQASGGTHKVSGFWVLLLLAILQIVIALVVIVPGRLRWIAVGLGCILSLGYWIVGQSVGAYYSGTATDPNSAPLYMLLGIALLGCYAPWDQRISAYLRAKKVAFAREFAAFDDPNLR